MKRNQKGFAVIETLLILVIVAMIAGVGCYVWHTNRQTKATLDAASKSAASTPPKTSKKSSDSTIGWKTYVSKEGKFTVKYPPSWVQPSNQTLCGDFLTRDLEIGPDTKSVIKCGGDGTESQVSVVSQEGDHRADAIAQLKGSGYIHQEAAEGSLFHGALAGGMTAVAMNQGEGLGSFPDGTIVDVRTYFKGNVTFIVTYTQLPASSNEGPTKDMKGTFYQILDSLRMEPYSDDRTQGP